MSILTKETNLLHIASSERYSGARYLMVPPRPISGTSNIPWILRTARPRSAIAQVMSFLIRTFLDLMSLWAIPGLSRFRRLLTEKTRQLPPPSPNLQQWLLTPGTSVCRYERPCEMLRMNWIPSDTVKMFCSIYSLKEPLGRYLKQIH